MPYVASSNLDFVEYDARKQELKITFQSSARVYHYLNVPLSVYNGLLRAKSKGKFFHHVIKHNYTWY